MMSVMKYVDMSGGTLHDQLKVAQSVSEKIKILEQILNPMLLKLAELVSINNDLVERYEQLRADFEMYKGEADKQRASMKHRSVTHMSARTMVHQLGYKDRQPELAQTLKFIARSFCKKEGIEDQIRRGEKEEGGKSHEWFPLAAAQYAMNKIKGEK
jgi:hypothetical protein